MKNWKFYELAKWELEHKQGPLARSKSKRKPKKHKTTVEQKTKRSKNKT
jgi:hypothetical protein